jgi:Flp pilus assembly protein TadG
MNRSSRQSRQGFVTVWVAITLAALLAFVGLMLDTSRAYTVGRELQDAADSAALAGMNQLSTSFSAAQTAAINAAADNTAAGASVQLANSDVVEGNYNSTSGAFTANGTPYNAIQVTARRTSGSPGGALNLIFGQIVGVTTCNISRTSVAFQSSSSSTTSAGFVLLDSSDAGALTMSGGAKLSCGGTGGALYIDSSNTKALTMSGGASLTASAVDIVGSDSVTGGASITGTVNTGATSVADPLSSLAEPTKNGDLGSYSIANGNTATLGTGDQSAVYYYSGGMSLAGSAKLTLNGGVYIIGPPGLSVSNGATLTANNCVFFFTNAGGSTYGTATFAGGTTTTITAPTTGTYANVAIFQDRSTPSTDTMTISNGASVSVSGTVYIPSASITYEGGTQTLGNQIIANELTVSNGASLSVNYDGRNPVVTGTASPAALGD